MYFSRKLKRAPFPKEMLVPFIVLPALLLLIKIDGPQLAFSFFAPVCLFIFAIGLLIFIRSGSKGHLLFSIVYFLLFIMSILFALYGKSVSRPLMGFILVSIFMISPFIIYMTYNRKMKWRVREMLELAAMPVETKESGFTERPFPVGKIDYSREVMAGFTDFLRTRLIALPVYEDEKTIFVINTSYSFIMGLNNKYFDKTWVSVDKDGNILVHISHKDYMSYREQYSFDKLCESLGNVFIEFYRYYHKGEGIRIIDQLNDLKLNPITEG